MTYYPLEENPDARHSPSPDLDRTRVVAKQGLPFALTAPNAATRAAMAEADRIVKIRGAHFADAEALFDTLDQETGPR